MFVSGRIRGRLLLIAVIAGLMFGGIAQAEQLSYAFGYPPKSIGDKAAQAYAQKLEELSDGELTIKIYPLSLLNFAETSAGIRDGIADSGLVLLPYFPSAYPSSNLVAELSMALELEDGSSEKAGLAYAGAMSEYIFKHCPECVTEFAKQNQVFTGGSASPPYYLLCTQPITSLADLKGKRLRAGGPQWSRWAAAMGASPITMSVNEIYEGMDQGVVDCTMQSTPELTIFSLMEVTSDITLGVPGGVFGGTGANNVSTRVWRGLSADKRRTLLHASATMSARITWLYEQAGINNLKTARKKGIAIHQATPKMEQARDAFVRKDLDTIAATYKKRYGIERAKQMIATFRPILEKWVGLVQDVDSSEELAKLYWNETFSKVDVSQYGM